MHTNYLKRNLAATILLAGLCLSASGQRPEEPVAPPKATKPKPAATAESEPDVDWQSIVGKSVRIETARDTEPDLAAAKVVDVVQDARTKKVRALKIETTASAKPAVMPIANLKRVSLDGKAVFESAKGKLETEQRAEWVARAKANNVVAWEPLAPEEHQRAIEQHREFMAGVAKVFPKMVLHETKEYLFYTDLPAAGVASLVKNLDEMHNSMCKLYSIKKGTPVWKGKCLVVVFNKRADWDQFRDKFARGAAPALATATCAQEGGMVMVNGSCGEILDAEFAATLVHETSHGFAYRWRTGQRLPSWVSEGLADLVAVTLVPATREKPAREAAAIGDLRKGRSIGQDFFAPKERVTGLQYGVALSLTKFMHKKNAKAYVTFLAYLKEGTAWDDALKQSYQMTPQQLLTAYGQTIGVPDLKYVN